MRGDLIPDERSGGGGVCEGGEPRLREDARPLDPHDLIALKVQGQIVAHASAHRAGDIGFDAEGRRLSDEG